MENKKSLGQNFLKNLDIISQITESAGVGSSDTVIEVGPGDGALTVSLLETGARVIAIELDEDLIPLLNKKFGDNANFTLIHADIRRFHLEKYLDTEGISKYQVVANLPYYITSSIIRYFLEQPIAPSQMTLMVQKEVGERICASAGSMSMLSLSVQYYGNPALILSVAAENFDPVPKVDSAVIQISQIKQRESQEVTDKMFVIAKSGFSARRKMLAKNLSNSLHYSREQVVEFMQESDISQTSRPQELSVDQWIELTKVVLSQPDL